METKDELTRTPQEPETTQEIQSEAKEELAETSQLETIQPESAPEQEIAPEIAISEETSAEFIAETAQEIQPETKDELAETVQQENIPPEPTPGQEIAPEIAISEEMHTKHAAENESEINEKITEEAEAISPEPNTGSEVVPDVEVEAELADKELEIHLPDLTFDPSASSLSPIAEIAVEEELDETEIISIAEENFEEYNREQLLNSLQKLVQEGDVNVIKSQVALIKVAFLKISKEEKQQRLERFLAEGGKKEEFVADDMTDEQFNAAFNIYKEKKSKYNEEFEKQKLLNLEAKNQILEELKTLVNSEETLKKTYDEFRLLQDRWKQIGMVPKNEINGLWQNYHFLVEKFFDKVKINKELKDLDLKKNLENKIALCEKVEELLLEVSIAKSFKQLQKLHEEWKEIGPVPQDKKDEIWERFKTVSDKINERRRDFYINMQDELQNNLVAKTLLCEKAEALISEEIKSIKSWQEKTNQVNELLKIWKTIGPASIKQNNEIWLRFRTSLENFFSAKKEFYSKLKDQQIENYNRKLDLCMQAEAIKSNTEWNKTTREFINMQKEWKKIGPVSRKNSEKIWKRFRAACDEFFNNKTTFFSNVTQMEQQNLQLKEALIKQVQEFVPSDNRNVDFESLKNFQRQWTEIGYVPLAEKDRLQNEFRTVINKHFDKLKVSGGEAFSSNYKNRFESVKNSPDAGKIISKERNFLATKISKLQEEIMLWENNIGFLANSKNANILREEFDKKINKAKEEVKTLEEKLKFLRSANNNQ
jgi:hypothetical protein